MTASASGGGGAPRTAYHIVCVCVRARYFKVLFTGAASAAAPHTRFCRLGFRRTADRIVYCVRPSQCNDDVDDAVNIVRVRLAVSEAHTMYIIIYDTTRGSSLGGDLMRFTYIHTYIHIYIYT